jgi:TonB-dependent starch-binding outer membrane protein SusC
MRKHGIKFNVGLLTLATVYLFLVGIPHPVQAIISMELTTSGETTSGVTKTTHETYTGIVSAPNEHELSSGHMLSWNSSVQHSSQPPQGFIVSGKVSDYKDGTTLPGVNVVEKGTNTGTVTDINGNFTLTVSDPNATIRFTFIGYLEEEVLLDGRNIINVALSPSLEMLKEVVVIGYGTIRKSDLTGSVSSVSGEDISRLPVLNVGQAMQGRAAGVQISSNSGSPGSPLRVSIRGVGTVGNNEPLYVVDGIPIDNIGFLNPNDIASIEILKDASAAAIYGSRAANGVVMITTKRGKSGSKSQITYSAYYGVQNPYKRYDVLNTMELAELHLEAFPANQKGRSVYFERAFDPETMTFNFAKLGVGTDWQSELLRQNAPMQSHNLSISGGSESGTYLLSFGYFGQDGIMKTTNAERYNLRLNSDYNVNSRLKTGISMALTSSNRFGQRENDKDGPLTQAMGMDPFVKVYDERDEFIWATGPIGFNPIASLTVNNYDGRQISNQIVGGVHGIYEITRHLQFKATYNTNMNFLDRDIFFPTYNMDRADHQRDISQLEKHTDRLQSWSQENTLTYSREFNKHNVTALVGYSNYYTKWTTNRGIVSGTFNDDPEFQHFSSAENVLLLRGQFTENTMTSYLSRVIYSYDDRLLLTASMRRDGSSKFGKDNKFGNFPSFSAGYKLSNHSFISQYSFIDMLKLRAGWGRIGNDQIPINAFTTTINPTQFYRYVFGDAIYQGAGPLRAGNSSLKWETSEQTNFGVDLALWGSRLQLTADYFTKITRDFLLNSPVPFMAGSMLYPWINAGKIQNKGIELFLSYRKLQGDFTYEVSGNFTAIKNKVLELNAENAPLVHGDFNRSAVGEELGHFFGWEMIGIFQTTEEIAGHAFQNQRTAPGDVKFKDQNGDGVIDIHDRVVIGSFLPDYTYGLNITLGYKSFDLITFLQGSQGNDVYNALKEQTSRGGRDNMNRENLNRWTGPGTSNTVPRVIYTDGNQNNRISSRFVEDASYLRVKNLQFGYTLPKNVSSRFQVDRLRIYMAANNLYTFTNYSGLDPEVGGDNLHYASSDRLVMGVDRGNYPQARSFLFGVELNF